MVEDLPLPAPLTLEREPENAFDGWAIKVLVDDTHIGYVEKETAAFLAPQLDDGEEFQCELTAREELSLTAELSTKSS